MPDIDVYAYGMISSSTLHLLSHPFPAPDGYAEIAQTYPMTGGEALNSSIVLSRLGVSVQLDGAWLGDSADGQRLLETIHAFGIDCQSLTVAAGYAGVREIVFSDERTRTVFGNYVALQANGRKWNIPRKEDIQRARLVCVDPFFGEESMLVGRYAAESQVPFVSIDCPFEHPLATGADVIIISGEFRDHQYPKADLPDLFREYQQRAQGLVVFTVGGEEILFGRPGEPVRRFKPHPVQVIDSAGAGDSFRSGIIYGLLQTWSDEDTICYAAALAGMICTRFPGVLNSPTHAEVMQFIRERA